MLCAARWEKVWHFRVALGFLANKNKSQHKRSWMSAKQHMQRDHVAFRWRDRWRSRTQTTTNIGEHSWCEWLLTGKNDAHSGIGTDSMQTSYFRLTVGRNQTVYSSTVTCRSEQLRSEGNRVRLHDDDDVVLRHTLPVFTGLGRCPIVSWDFVGAVSIFGPDALPVIHQWPLPGLEPATSRVRVAAHNH